MRQVKKNLRKKINILVSAGPTKAYLDDVRYLSNYSTGELGYILCKELLKKYSVLLVAGNTHQPYKDLKLKHLKKVNTNQEMRRAVLQAIQKYQPDYFISTAAVLDFEPVFKSKGKVSSKNKNWVVQLKPAPKIIDEVKKKFPETKIIAFKLETTPLKAEQKYVKSYSKKKGLLGVCLNYLSQIKKSRHKATLYTSKGSKHLKTKLEIAMAIKKTIEKDLKITYNSTHE